jgi:protein TonB
MRIIFILVFCLLTRGTRAQDTLQKMKESMDSSTFLKVEVESEYPGGNSAWGSFLRKTVRYPEDAIKKNVQGAIQVQFIVDKDGRVSHIQALSGPETGGLREEAERVIGRSGKWTPAIQNGKYVKSYKIQPIIFKLEPR